MQLVLPVFFFASGMRGWIFCFLFPCCLNAQIKDDFTDGDLDKDPVWYLHDGAFVNTGGILQSSFSTPNASFCISSPAIAFTNSSCRLDYKLSFNTSSVNYVDLFLESDSLNLLNCKNGLFIRAGGSTDEISLFVLTNGSETKLSDGTDGVLNHSSNQFKIEVDRYNDSVVLRHFNSKDSLISVRSCKYPGIKIQTFAGIRIRQSTASFFGKHVFDNFYLGPLIRDSIPPGLDTIVYLGNGKISIDFSEKLNDRKLKENDFLISELKCLPDSFKMIDNGREILLYFSCLNSNEPYHLCVDSLTDLAGNLMKKVCRSFFTLQPVRPKFQDLVFNEILPDPDPVVGLENKEYVEIFNRSKNYIDLNGLKICDPQSCKLINVPVIFPDSFLLVYDLPSLNNSEDRLRLLDPDSSLIHSIHYTLDWYGDDKKKEGGYSLELMDPYQLCLGKDNWKASIDSRGGTPGSVNSVRTDLPDDIKAPCLLRTETKAPDLLNLFFNESFDTIPQSVLKILRSDTIWSAKILDQKNQFGMIKLQMPFVPDPKVKYNLKISGPEDCDQNKIDTIQFKVQWLANALKHDLIINEVLFNPKTGGRDFIELYNRSDKYIDLTNCFIVDEEQNRIKAMFPISGHYSALPPGTFLLMSTDTSIVCRDYHCPDTMVMKLQMTEMPSMPDEGVSFYIINPNFETIDSLVCTEDWHYDLLGDKNGVSLERIDPDNFEMSGNNWHSASFVSGYASPGAPNSQLLKMPMNSDHFSINTNVLSPDGDAYEDFLVIHYLIPAPDYLCSVRVFNLSGELVSEPYNNRSIGTSGQLTWDCLDLNGNILSEGHYLMIIQCNNPNLKPVTAYFTLFVSHSEKK